MGNVVVRPRLVPRIAAVALLSLLALTEMLPARADLYSATQAYKKGEYSHAFHQFRALARLGQPVAQLDLAYMYYAGQGTRQSAISAYAWATLAAQNGETKGGKLAKQLLPTLALAPGSRRVAKWITAPYTLTALQRRLLPTRFPANSAQHPARVPMHACRAIHSYKPDFPLAEELDGEQQGLIVGFTLMPDGTARLPHILFQLPSQHDTDFDKVARESVLGSKFGMRPPGSRPIQCAIYYRFQMSQYTAMDYPRLEMYLHAVKRGAQAGDPKSELYYGVFLMGGLPQIHRNQSAALRWFVKAAQAGIPLAQFEVGANMLMGWTTPRQVRKALRWLHLAAVQHEPHAEAMLARRLLHGDPSLSDVQRAVQLLDRAAAKSSRIGELYLSAVLAASPQPSIRDPAYALKLEKKVFAGGSNIDPTALEIRAAAHAAEGDFKRAVINERNAIGRARNLGWNLSALKTRLKRYQSGKPWFGNLLHYG